MEPTNTAAFRRKLTILAAIAFVLVVIAASAAMRFIIDNSSPITISNKNDIKGLLDDNDYQKMKTVLHKLLEDKYGIAPDAPVDATIRESSYTDKTNGVEGTISFLLDIDSLKLTYTASVVHSSTNNLDISFGCPKLSASKYPETFCIATDNYSTIDVELDKKLPYSGYIDEVFTFRIRHDVGVPKLTIEIYTLCGDDEAYNHALSEAKKWINSNGISADLIPYEAPKNYCLQFDERKVHG